MAILTDVKTALRISTAAYDDEITDLIEACQIDLTQSGVDSTNADEKFIKRAIILYAKANFGMANPDMEKYLTAYERQKTFMALTTAYGEGVV